MVALDRAQRDPVWWVETSSGTGSGSGSATSSSPSATTLRRPSRVATAPASPSPPPGSRSGSFTPHHPSIVITTAPTDRQVRGILWKEIRAAHARSRYPLGGTLLSQELKLR